ncbi:hypothetical protein [Leptospira weilii]|uniref:hypothetical protein n=1 Tax=Leptospira weilii TaxID=28184 RepID=UPI000AFD10B7|nr:hypothetical protein [Leptospira weilii]
MESQENTDIAKRKKRFWALVTIIAALTLGLLVGPFLALNGKYGVVLFIGTPFSIGILFVLSQFTEKVANFFWVLLLPFTVIPLLLMVTLFSEGYNWRYKAFLPLAPFLLPAIFLVCIFFIFIFAQSKKTALWQSLLVFFLFIVSPLVGVLIIGAEGFICILMALPIFYILFLIGVAIGYFIRFRILSKYLLLLIVFTFNISAYVYDRYDSKFETNEVQTSLVVHAPAEEVWKRITSPFTFGEADHFFFRNGISYPVSMKLVQENGRSLLAVDYSNGTTVAAVTTLDENDRMGFSFPEPQITMVETSLYREVEPKHIRGKIWAVFGEFRLVPISKTEVKIVATTRYVNSLGPKFYWKLWADYLMDELHQHVLRKIKLKVEEKNYPK